MLSRTPSLRRSFLPLVVLFLAFSVSIARADNNPSKDLDAVRRQFKDFPVTSGSADDLFADFVTLHVAPVRQAHQLLVEATQGKELTSEQARQIMDTFRPVLQVDAMRRMVVHGLTNQTEDADQYFASRKLLLETLARHLPAEFSPILHRYSALLARIHETYATAPQLAPRLDRAWLKELDAIRAMELAMNKQQPPPQSHRLAKFSKVRGQNDRPICGAASLAMGLEVAQQQAYDPADIANVIGWDGTTGPMMWAYAHQHAAMKKARLQVLSMSELKELVSRNIPVVILQHFSKEKNFGHARLIVGYNDAQGKIQYVESADAAVRTMDYSECEKLWAPLLFTALILEQ
jgi:hypothetical protein